MKIIFSICFVIVFSLQIFGQIPVKTLMQISRAEDELRYDNTLQDLMKNQDANTRLRAALAAGRIGAEAAIPILVNLLEKDSDVKVRATAAFALGEIESNKAADAILRTLKLAGTSPEVRARALEAAGKIAAAILQTDKKKSEELGTAILNSLDDESIKPKSDHQTILLGITAILRARPENGEFIAAKYLTNANARIRADAANTLTRLKAKNANEQLRTMLFKDKDPIARANAARALGASEDKDAFDLLLGTALNDEDARVRVSSIRSIGSLKNTKAADRLLERAEILLTDYKKSKSANPSEKNELLEIATTLGRLLPNSNNKRAIDFLSAIRDFKVTSPEIEIALARLEPKKYVATAIYTPSIKWIIEGADSIDWRSVSSIAQGYGEIGSLEKTEENFLIKKDAEEKIGVMISNPLGDEKEKNKELRYIKAVPDVLRAYAAFKPNDLHQVLRRYFQYKDVIIRATTAELLGEQPLSKENTEALKTAFTKSLLTDKQYNDAQLAILDALFKLDKKQSVPTLLIALDAPDYLVRKKAFDLLRAKDLEKDFPGLPTMLENALAKKKDQVLRRTANNSKLGVILNTNADYVRAVMRKSAKAIITTEKGTFTIEFFPEDAPLTVDNFIKLTKSNYFDNVTIHRVVPNFVMQDGDPRGDGNGGPGWQIRDEINEIPYERGMVGMALSGKDTGGSQWFVTHSPQPHLDGGYTVFGKVNETDMKIVDNLVRGDKILSVKIVEGNLPQRTQSLQRKS
jgi:cyclophilin family peptidyl-prolyl cis-trans isomerase/HEAT repeat protein